MAEVVNLDALIPREDFLASDQNDVVQDGKTDKKGVREHYLLHQARA